MKLSLLIFAVLMGSAFLSFAEKAPPETTRDNGYVEPFQILDNLYYVGDQWVSSYLVKTEMGLILIDTMDYPYSKWLPSSFKRLGLDVSDLKYIVITHGHADHVSGAGYLQKLTGAKVVMSKGDLYLMIAQAQERGFMLPEIDISPKDGDVIRLGEFAMTFHHTPGHTEGCISNEFMAFDKGKPVKAFVMCGNSTSFEGVNITKRYIKSVENIKEMAMKAPVVSVNLPSHPHLGQLFERQRLKATEADNPFVDHKGFMQFIRLLEKRGKEKLLVEQDKRKDVK